jgi:hypothetical protein
LSLTARRICLRSMLVGLERNFFRQHDIACNEIASRYKAPADPRTAATVDLADIHRGAMANPIMLCDVEIAFCVILRRPLSKLSIGIVLRGLVVFFENKDVRRPYLIWQNEPNLRLSYSTLWRTARNAR